MEVPWRKVRVHCGSGLSLAEIWHYPLAQLVAGQEENLLSFCWGNKVKTSSCWKYKVQLFLLSGN